MILTADEYHRGFISFDGEVPPGGRIQLWIRTSDEPTEDTEWTGPYTDPVGSKVLSPPLKYMQLKIGMGPGPDPHRTPLFQRARLERDGVTQIWPGSAGVRGLVLGRDFGSSYRLILRPRRAEWPMSLALLASNYRVRFWKEPLTGFVGTGLWKLQQTPAAGDLEPLAEIPKESTEGDVLEVLATVPGDSEASMETARYQVESLVGLLAFALGEGLTGPVLIEEFSVATPEGEFGEIRMPIREVGSADLNLLLPDAMSQTASTLETDAGLVAAEDRLGLALRWLYRGHSSNSLLDAFLAFFIGLEVLAARWFADLDPAPVRGDYSELEAYFRAASPPPGRQLAKRILARLSDFPLDAKLQQYWQHHSLADPAKPLRDLVDLRNKIAHGAITSVSSSTVAATRDALKKALSAELACQPSGTDGLLDLLQVKFTITSGP